MNNQRGIKEKLEKMDDDKLFVIQGTELEKEFENDSSELTFEIELL